MKFIANAGNIEGRFPIYENRLDYVDSALLGGYDVKVDVWWHNDEFYLGTDYPRYTVPPMFLELPNVWCQAKNIRALEKLLEISTHSLWFTELFDYQNVVLSSQNVIWSADQLKDTSNYVLYVDQMEGVVPEIYGICCNNVLYAREFITELTAPRLDFNRKRNLNDILPDDFFDGI